MRDFVVKDFKYGIVNNIEDQSIPAGAASNSKNWLTKGDHIELCRGSRLLGDTEISGNGRVDGIFVARKANGDEVYFKKYNRKVLYLVPATDTDWTEIGTNILPVAAESDDVTFAEYASLAGNQVWLNSPNGTLIKIMTANPGSYADMYDSSKNFKGYIAIQQNRMKLWGRVADKTGVYGSYIDTQNYTTVSSEATTSGGGTLAFKGGGAKRTCFGVTITLTVSGEVYTDDYSGNLTGSLGGTGTINYMTGAYTLSNTGVGTASYQWEDSTSGGIADFTKSSPRTAGQGFVFRQDDGGAEMKTIISYGVIDYCLHLLKTWELTLTSTDTGATNLIFREKVGIPYLRAAVGTGTGIYHIDYTDKNKPKFRILTLAQGSDKVIPREVTLKFNFEDYVFDKCAMIEFNEFIAFSGRTSDSDVNNRLFLYNKTWDSIDILDKYVSCMAIGNGTLLAGESISDNVVTLFSGFDDDDSLIDNFWEGDLSNLGIENRMKKVRKLILEGNIVPNQSYDVYVAPDNGAYVNIGTVSGSGNYVDRGQAIYVGATTIGSKEIGGGSDGVTAYHYLREIAMPIDKFLYRKIKFVATGIGYVSISKTIDHDIRLRSAKIPAKYRS